MKDVLHSRTVLRPYLFPILFCIVVSITCGLLGVRAYLEAARAQDERILATVNTIARGIAAREVTALAGTEGDIGISAYRDLKTKLIAMRAANHDIRFIYLMVETEAGIAFVVDSEPEDSEDY